ncbi:MAG: hypothetical protein LBC64_09530 [Fibromonadaceae bacterium]|jgi:hypothetical protein|nr:hypothetical protein [Fibromonadaceae bacterium]
MLKKIIAVCAITLFFACSAKDDGFVYGEDSSSSNQAVGGTSSSSIPSSYSSSSEGDEGNSSSSTVTIVVITSEKRSALFGTYYYGYALKDSKPEPIEDFWDPECPTTAGIPPKDNCQLDSTNTILRNRLTTRDAPLHYDFPFPKYSAARGYVELKEYILKGAGDQAAVGLNVSDDGKDIGEWGNPALNGTAAFIYRYSGAAHIFRIVSKIDGDFWYKEVPATPSKEGTDSVTVRIPTSELAGMGSYAEGTAFDISKVAKFLWVVEYDAANVSKNTGSLRIENLSAELE